MLKCAMYLRKIQYLCETEEAIVATYAYSIQIQDSSSDDEMLGGESSQDDDSSVHFFNAELSEHSTDNSTQVTLPEDQCLMTLLSDCGYN